MRDVGLEVSIPLIGRDVVQGPSRNVVGNVIGSTNSLLPEIRQKVSSKQ
jgi:hypothetical protein